MDPRATDSVYAVLHFKLMKEDIRGPVPRDHRLMFVNLKQPKIDAEAGVLSVCFAASSSGSWLPKYPNQWWSGVLTQCRLTARR